MGLHASSLQNPGINAKPDSDWRLDIFCGHTRTHTLHIIGFQNRKKVVKIQKKAFFLFFFSTCPRFDVWKRLCFFLFRSVEFRIFLLLYFYFAVWFLFLFFLAKGCESFFHSNLWRDKISIFTSVNGAWFILDIRLRELLCYTKHKCYTFEQSQIIG